MYIRKSKKGFLGYEAIITIVIVVAFATLAMRSIINAQDKLDEPLRLATCKKLNEIRYGIRDINPIDEPIGPNACRTIDKTGANSVPTNNYQETYQQRKNPILASKTEIRDMVKNCWGEWLEGTKFDMFSKIPIFGDQQCFVCYTFSIKDKADGFTFLDFDNFIDEPLEVVDLSDQCAKGGGGRCIKGNECTGEVYSRQVLDPVANKCKYDEVCCITRERDECIDKGGQCMEKPNQEFPRIFPDWKCDEGNCYVKEKTDDKWIYISYRDYIQKNNGFITYSLPESVNNLNDIKFGSDDVYAVTFLSPGEECGTKCYMEFAGIGALTVAGVAATIFIPGSGLAAKVAGKPLIKAGSKIVAPVASTIGRGIKGSGKAAGNTFLKIGIGLGLIGGTDAVVDVGTAVAETGSRASLRLLTERQFTNMILISRLSDIEQECKPIFGDE